MYQYKYVDWADGSSNKSAIFHSSAWNILAHLSTFASDFNDVDRVKLTHISDLHQWMLIKCLNNNRG